MCCDPGLLGRFDGFLDRMVIKTPTHRVPQDVTHTPTTRHTRDSLETYRSSLSTLSIRVLREFFKSCVHTRVHYVRVDSDSQYPKVKLLLI